ncbi:MAG: hypothetical protein IJB97_04880, partial [Clostridia bacterium]|nr:hypothetical protein [Clostridia bacterium]
LFTDERQMHVQIFLDCSASMGKDDPKKANYAVAVAAALGFLAVHNMDKLSLNMIKGNRAENPFGTIVGKTSFFRAVSELENITFSEDSNLEKAITSSPNTGSSDGLTVIISDFFTKSDWKKAVDYLTYKKRQVLLVQIMTPDEREPVYDGRLNLIDSEAEDLTDPRNMKIRITRSMQLAYQDALNDFKADLKSFCVSRGAEYIFIDTEKSIEKMLFGELLKVGIMA